jgi:tetratricopeptide (TPR) repeat protein
MPIWSAEIIELEKLYESLKGQLPHLDKELERLVKADDENIILLYSRRCLEVIITDLCECELRRERGTEPLKGIIDKLNKEKKVPSHIITSMHGLNDLSTYGTHPKDFDPEQIKPVLNNLDIIIKWYLKYKHLVAVDKTEVDKEKIRLRKEPTEEVTGKERTEVQKKPSRAGERKLISIAAISAILVIAAILAYPKIFKRDTLEKLRSSGERISVAVMPFRNMTGDVSLSNWQDDIQYNLIVYLSNFRQELIVRGRESITNILHDKGLTADYNSITTSVASSISDKLDADIFIDGSINQSGSTIRLNVQLVDTKTTESLKSFQIDGTVEKKFALIDTLSVWVKDFLIISKLERNLSPDFLRLTSVNSPEAFRYFISGQNAFNERDWPTAAKLYSLAITLDSNFSFADLQLIYALCNQGLYEDAKKYALKLYEKKDQMPMQQKIFANYAYAMLFESPYEEIKYLKQGLEFDDQLPACYFGIGIAYRKLNQYDKAIPEYEKALAIYDKWGVKPMWTGCYSHLGFLYHKTGQYEKEEELYKKAEIAFPDNSDLVQGQATLSLSEGNKDDANRFINQYISIRKEKSVSEASIINGVAEIYSNAGFLEKAEEYYRQALSLEPENPVRMNTLAYFLIDKDRNIGEGLELVNRALELNPEDYEYLHTKGWGLFKQGKSREASDLLQKSWELRREKAVYDHEALLHLEAAKKVVSGLN